MKRYSMAKEPTKKKKPEKEKKNKETNKNRKKKKYKVDSLLKQGESSHCGHVQAEHTVVVSARTNTICCKSVAHWSNKLLK